MNQNCSKVWKCPPTTARRFPRPDPAIQQRRGTFCIQEEISSSALTESTCVCLCSYHRNALKADCVLVMNFFHDHSWFCRWRRHFPLSLWSDIRRCCNKAAFIQSHSTALWIKTSHLGRESWTYPFSSSCFLCVEISFAENQTSWSLLLFV